MNRIAYLENLIKDNSEDPFPYFALAKEHEKLEQWSIARHYYEYLVKVHGDYVGTYYHLGKLYEFLGLRDEAISTYRNGIDIAGKAGDEHSKQELQGAVFNLELE